MMLNPPSFVGDLESNLTTSLILLDTWSQRDDMIKC